MKPSIDMDRIARALGAERGGAVRAAGGYFGASELAAEIKRHFHIPANGGRPTDPRWTERRLVGLSPATLKGLQNLATGISRTLHVRLDPMQAAALVLENSLRQMGNAGAFAKKLVAQTGGVSRAHAGSVLYGGRKARARASFRSRVPRRSSRVSR